MFSCFQTTSKNISNQDILHLIEQDFQGKTLCRNRQNQALAWQKGNRKELLKQHYKPYSFHQHVILFEKHKGVIANQPKAAAKLVLRLNELRQTCLDNKKKANKVMRYVSDFFDKLRNKCKGYRFVLTSHLAFKLAEELSKPTEQQENKKTEERSPSNSNSSDQTEKDNSSKQTTNSNVSDQAQASDKAESPEKKNSSSDQKEADHSLSNALSNEPPRYPLLSEQQKQLVLKRLRQIKHHKDISKDFIDKIIASDLYSPDEKNQLSTAADDGYPNGLHETTHESVTIRYLLWWLTAIKPEIYSTFPGQNQPNHKQLLEKEGLRKIIDSLPSLVTEGPRIYGHPLRIGGDEGGHRTAIVIDMDEKKVEFYDSMGDDSQAKPPLLQLTQALTDRYKTAFTYVHKTQGTQLQKDGINCGIWTCKMIEERVAQGVRFEPRSLIGFNIGDYRKEVFAKNFARSFYHTVGRIRYDNYLEELISDDKKPVSPEIINLFERSARSLLAEDMQNKLGRPINDKDVVYLDKVAFEKLEMMKIEWGEKGVISQELKELMQRTIAKIIKP